MAFTDSLSSVEISLLKKNKIDPKQDKTNKMTCALREDLNHSQADQCLRCALNGLPRTKGLFMRTAKTLVRPGGCRT